VEEFEHYTKVLDFQTKGSFLTSFFSALYMAAELNQSFPFGSYLWERVWPKRENDNLIPEVSSWGKYYVKLFFKGKERLVVVDDLIPQDEHGKILFPMTDYFEFWPTILFKAIIAISEGFENVVFSDAYYCFSKIFPDFITQYLSCNNCLEIIGPISQALMAKREAESTFNLVKFLCKQPNPDFNSSNRKFVFLSCRSDLEETSGLRKESIFMVQESRTYKGETMLRVVTGESTWNGKFAYKNSSFWDAKLEQELGFCYQDRRINSRLKDFWIELTELGKYFDKVHVLHENSKYGVSASLAQTVVTATNPIVIYVTETTKLFIRLQGQKDKLPLVNIQRANNWKKLTPAKTLHEFSVVGYDSVLPLTLPCREDFEIYELRFSGVEDQMIDFVSQQKLTFGTQEDIYSTKLSQSIQKTQNLSSPAQEDGEWKIWSM